LTSRIVAPLYDAVEQLSPRADFHDQVHAALVFVGPLQPRDVLVARQVMHDLHLPLNILDVFRSSADKIRIEGKDEGRAWDWVGAKRKLGELLSMNMDISPEK
jgi:hypothetical protein